MWSSTSGSEVETYDTHNIRDPLAAAVDPDTGVVYVLVGQQLMMISQESPKDGEQVAVPAAESLEPFFTPGQGKKCPALATEKHVLIVSKTKLLIVNCDTKESREVGDSRWCLCAADGPKIILADKDGSVYAAEHRLSSPSFPGKMTLVSKCDGSHTAVDANCMEKVEDFVKEPEYIMRPRDSSSVITALDAHQGKFFFCRGHGLYRGDPIEEILKDERSSNSFAFPSALFLRGNAVFSQCADGIRKLDMISRSVSLALPAGDMVIQGDAGSPQPYPKDFVGIDGRFCYFLVERDFRTGQALRRWPHHVAKTTVDGSVAVAPVDAAPAGATEMKVTAKKGAGLYIRSAERMLQGPGSSATSTTHSAGQRHRHRCLCGSSSRKQRISQHPASPNLLFEYGGSDSGAANFH
eukprot:s1779_g8.t1